MALRIRGIKICTHILLQLWSKGKKSPSALSNSSRGSKPLLHDIVAVWVSQILHSRVFTSDITKCPLLSRHYIDNWNWPTQYLFVDHNPHQLWEECRLYLIGSLLFWLFKMLAWDAELILSSLTHAFIRLVFA